MSISKRLTGRSIPVETTACHCSGQAAELAERSTARATRVAACELLHAALLWVVGTNARAPEPSDPTQDARPTQFHAILVRSPSVGSWPYACVAPCML